MTRMLTYVEIDVPAFAGGSPLQTFRFAEATDYLPSSIDAIPSISSVSFEPATISLGENLGQRASLKVSFMDHRHVFNGEAYDQGTFWGKWRGRYGAKLRGCNLRLIRGLVGQAIGQMDTRHYIVDATDGPTPQASYMIEAKDVLKLADDDRSQAPVISNGSLAGTINAITTSASLSPVGIGNLEYPASGWICLGGKEVVSFTRAGDSLSIARGQFGSVAQAHDSGERAQLVLRYAGADVASILYDLLVNYAAIPAAYINLPEWQAETAAHLGVIYAATLCEATSVKKLVSELIQQAALALWWDDRARKIKLQVLREISTSADIFGEDRILEGSLKVKEQPLKRISQIWSYYGQRDPTDAAAKEDGYRAALASVDLALEDAYGSAAVTKIQCRWIETLSAAERLNQIQLSRFRDPPRSFSFGLKFDEQVTLAGGYQLTWWANQNALGNPVPAKIQVTKITRYPDRVEIEAEEMLASGVIVLTNTVFLLTTGAVLSWPVPLTFNNANNSVSVIGAGAGAGRGGSNGGKGAGGGAFSRKSNLTLTPGGAASYRVGARGTGQTVAGAPAIDGGDTWFNGASFGAASVAAKGGQAASFTSGGQGGQASGGIGDLKTSGGNGGNGFNDGGGGGGGAGGPNGNGADGGNSTADGGSGGGAADGGNVGGSTGGAGADGGNNRFNFGGGTASSPTGDEGGGGRGGTRAGDPGGNGGDGEQLWTQTFAPIISAGPGAGGGGGDLFRNGYDGGFYGGGGGGGGTGGEGREGGKGQQGIIVMTWRNA
jgi:hypothetical protein